MALAMVPFVAEEVGVVAEVIESGILSLFRSPVTKFIGATAAGNGVYDLAKHTARSGQQLIVHQPIHELTKRRRLNEDITNVPKDITPVKRGTLKRRQEEALSEPIKRQRQLQEEVHESQKKRALHGVETDNSSKADHKNNNRTIHFNSKSLKPTSIDNMVGTGLPKTQKVTHRFVIPLGGADIMIPEADNYQAKAFCANSLEAPALALGVSNPSYEQNAVLFAQYASFYDKYNVIGSTIRLDYTSTNPSSGTNAEEHGFIIGIGLKDDTTKAVAPWEYISSNECVWKAISPEQSGTIVAHVKPHEYFGSAKPSSDSTLHVAAASSGDGRADNSLYFHVWIYSPSAIDADGISKGILGIITIDYDVIWMEPRGIMTQDALDPTTGGTYAIKSGQ